MALEETNLPLIIQCIPLSTYQVSNAQYSQTSLGTLDCPLRTVGDPWGPLGGPLVPKNGKQNVSNHQISLCLPLK